jgi:hypothetical protein
MAAAPVVYKAEGPVPEKARFSPLHIMFMY